MGYESRIIVIDKEKITSWTGNEMVITNELAVFNLSCMGYKEINGKSFRDLFTTPIDFDLLGYVDDEEDPDIRRQDMYGEHCKYTTNFDEVIEWLEASEKEDPYRRSRMLLGFLKSFKDNVKFFNEVCLVHYGY